MPLDKKVEAAKRLKRSYELTGQKPKGVDANLIKEYEEWIEPGKKPPPEHYVEVAGLPDKAKEGLAHALKEAVEFGRNTGRECLIHIDARTGEKVYATIEGEKDQVIISSTLRDFLSRAEERSIIQVHNHPRSSSFSDADIIVTMAHESISHIVVIGHDGTRYIFSRGNGQKPDQREISLQWLKLRDKYYNQFAQEVIAGRMTEEQAWKEHSHLIMQDLAEMYGWEYRRVMPNEI
ncbi:hypothetical protein SAMN00808754_1952 [Thermanaeromonas toyohensis ToBE]|uniref:Uncharacterized protein n=1 Tax=Thermanaeromonas toyohensis ToBE TaxID=698762 RepID=A0A1W1VWQ6_9FIRM|nr:hypothetical protein [Thermanaeromonas toyohensis]SMB97795.1 hypothetical protein SAMN00808754_1952 [Thermanaeromonas toyohensis ToBE]